MTRILTYSVIAFSIGAMASCTTVEEDVQKYCDCVEEVESGFEMRKCIEIANDIWEKYQYDPEASEYIEENLKDCGNAD